MGGRGTIRSSHNLRLQVNQTDQIRSPHRCCKVPLTPFQTLSRLLSAGILREFWVTDPKARATTRLRNRTMKGTAVGGGGKTGREKTGTVKRTETLAVAAPAAGAAVNTSSLSGMMMTTTTTTMTSTIETRDTRRPQVATRHPVPAITSLRQDMEHPHMRLHLVVTVLRRTARPLTVVVAKTSMTSSTPWRLSYPSLYSWLPSHQTS